jgi:hypothetical protein
VAAQKKICAAILAFFMGVLRFTGRKTWRFAW